MNDRVNLQGSGNSDEINLLVLAGDMWRGFLKFWWVGVMISLIFAGYQFYQNYIRYTPIYTCTTTFTVQMESAAVNAENGLSTYSFSYNRTVSEQLTDVFNYVVSSSIVQQKVCEDLGIPEIPAAVVAHSVSDSNMVTLTATGQSPEMLSEVLESVIRNYSSVAEYMIGRTKLVIIIPPEVPTTPSNLRERVGLVLGGAAVGLGVGLVLLVLYAFLRSTVRTQNDIRVKLNQNCLGALPQVTFKKHRQSVDNQVLISNPRIGHDYLESMRLLCSAVRGGLGGNGQVVMVTSSAPGEGKSITTLNLAAMLAKNEDRVLVVDCDVCSSGIRAVLGERVTAGTLISPFASVHRVTDLGIDLLSFDSADGRLRHMVRVDILDELIKSMRGHYDFILMDTPPCGVISNAVCIAALADGVVYVIRQDAIILSGVRAGIDSILSADARLLGCVLNGATGGFDGYGSHYNYRGYSRYYRSNLWCR